MDTELSKTADNCGDHSTSEQGMEKTQQSLEPSEKPDDKQSKSVQAASNESLEKMPATLVEAPGEEVNPKQKGQKKKPRNPFMPQVAAKNKRTEEKNGDKNGDSGSDLAEVLLCSSYFNQ